MRIVSKLQQSLRLIAIALLFMVLSVSSVAPASATVNNPAPSAKVTFTFDDGLSTNISQAAPALAAYGLNGTAYITTGCIGMTTTPNTCAADEQDTYMTWEQVTQLQNTYGWEIAAHTVNHPQLATDGLTKAQIDSELANSKAALAAHGFNATNFATPYGDYNDTVLAEIAKYYASHRGFHDVDNNIWSYNDYLINNMQVQAGVTVAQVKSRIDQAIANNQWLVLTFHDVRANASTDPQEYEYPTANLTQIAAYVKSKKDAGLIKPVNVKDGLVTSTTNLFTNGGFENGLSGGWATDTATNVVADSGTNGSYPEPAKSVAITTGATNTHLFSPKIAVDSAETYMFKSFLNLTARTSGELGYYIDEYNAAGSWISGKWIKSVTAPTVQSINFTYTPSSVNVKKASLQVYTTANSGIKAYVDQFQFFSLTNNTLTPPPATANLLPNSTFDAGLTNGWATDKPTAFSTDGGNHGSSTDPINSMKMTAGTANAHLFAPRVSVSSTSTYAINTYANLATRTSSELGFYIDEYDASGGWVSGQYAYGHSTTGASNISFSYQPTGVNVKQAQLQIILPANSGITGYLDTVQFMAPANEAPAPTPTNLMPNATFDAGLTNGWTTNDAANIKADSANHGSPANPINSIALVSNTVNRHLFSPQIAADPTKSYNVSTYLDLQQLTGGEVGFYIDEYDAGGNWISGQYKTGINIVSKGDVTFTYTPSSATVKTASLQVIVTGNSGTNAYVDDVRWIQK
jgi:peptidoglycan/xylan/chitin deacetylase (PgdA/CDA1 family)